MCTLVLTQLQFIHTPLSGMLNSKLLKDLAGFR